MKTFAPKRIPAREVEAVRASAFFDEDYYRSRFKIDWTGIDPAERFCALWKEHLVDPSAQFDIRAWLASHPEEAMRGLNPLLACAENSAETGQPDPDIFRLEGGDLVSPVHKRGRFAIFAAGPGQKLHEHVIYNLEQLAVVCDIIIFSASDYYPFTEILKVRDYSNYFICFRHKGGYFGSYANGLEIAIKHNLQNRCDELVLCNDAVYGPIYDYAELFRRMPDSDIASITANPDHNGSLHSYFMSLKTSVLRKGSIADFFASRKGAGESREALARLEKEFTEYARSSGLACKTLVDCDRVASPARGAASSADPLLRPAACIEAGSPFIPVRAMLEPARYNEEGALTTLAAARKVSPSLRNLVAASLASIRGGGIAPHFSIIMPAWNRSSRICASIDSALSQTWPDFELIIVDDGSSDNTAELARERYAEAMASGKLVYIRLEKNSGVSHARNVGLLNARNDWIAYLDSDNAIAPRFLETYAYEIMANPETLAFYSKILRINSGEIIGGEFDHAYMVNVENRIDMGSFVHHKSLFRELGGFDEQMSRFVDYDLILRYTGVHTPVFIDAVLTWYDDGRLPRITNNVSQLYYHQLVRHKHAGDLKVTTVLIYGSDPDERSLASALGQHGKFAHDLAFYAGEGNVARLAAWRGSLHPGNPAFRAPILDDSGLLDLAANSSAFAFAFLRNGDRWLSPRRLEKLALFLRLHPEWDIALAYDRQENAGETVQPVAPVSSLIIRKEKLAQLLSAAAKTGRALGALLDLARANEPLAAHYGEDVAIYKSPARSGGTHA